MMFGLDEDLPVSGQFVKVLRKPARSWSLGVRGGDNKNTR